MSNVALSAISITVGLFFVFFGSLKLCPLFSEELYRDMRKIFIKSHKALPFQSFFKELPSPHAVRRAYGSLEVICGTILAMCPGLMRDVSNAVLILLMLFNLYGTWMLNEGFKEASHALVFGLLLTCRVIIRIQVWSRDHETCDPYTTSTSDLTEECIKERVACLQRDLLEAKRLASMRRAGGQMGKGCINPACNSRANEHAKDLDVPVHAVSDKDKKAK